MKIRVSWNGTSWRLLKLPSFRGKGGPLSSGSKVQEGCLIPSTEDVNLLEMSVNNYQLRESDISEDLDLPQHRRQNVNPQTALPHSLLQNVCDLFSESWSNIPIRDMQVFVWISRICWLPILVCFNYCGWVKSCLKVLRPLVHYSTLGRQKNVYFYWQNYNCPRKYT